VVDEREPRKITQNLSPRTGGMSVLEIGLAARRIRRLRIGEREELFQRAREERRHGDADQVRDGAVRQVGFLLESPAAISLCRRSTVTPSFLLPLLASASIRGATGQKCRWYRRGALIIANQLQPSSVLNAIDVR
jgi:hypothetical protein